MDEAKTKERLRWLRDHVQDLGWPTWENVIIELVDEAELLAAEKAGHDEEIVELIEGAFEQIAHYAPDGYYAGWYDTMSLSIARDLGNWLVTHGTWERHSEGAGRRWFYRRKEKSDG